MSEYYIVIDQDEQRRHAMCTLLSVEGYVIPLGSIDEIQGRWPEQAWIFAGCDRDNLEYICRYLKNAERFYPIVPFGKSPSDRLIMDLINLGCIGYINLPSNRHVINKTISALRAAAARVMAQRGRQMEADRKMRLLSPRETQVVRAICQGLSNKSVANALGISPRTVEIHRSNAMAKLGAQNAVDLVRMLISANDCEQALLGTPIGAQLYTRAA